MTFCLEIEIVQTSSIWHQDWLSFSLLIARLSSFDYISKTFVSIANVAYAQTGKSLGTRGEIQEAILIDRDVSQVLFLNKSLLME